MQNNEKLWRSDFQVCSFGSIEHVDRFVGMAHHLRVKMEMKLHHLLRDTAEFVDELRHLQRQDGMRMVKIDIKEFYM